MDVIKRVVTDPMALLALAVLITIEVTLFVIWGFTLAEHNTARTIVYSGVLSYCAFLVAKQLGGYIMMRAAYGSLGSGSIADTVSQMTGFAT